MITPLFDFGFVYEWAGKSFSLVVTAPSRDGAKSKLAAMCRAECVGKMLKSEACVERSNRMRYWRQGGGDHYSGNTIV